MKNSLVETVKRFPKCRFVVVGDLIADEFLYGRIARVSREAPVLVLEYHSLVRVPGGAANAANNLLDLGCSVAIAGTVGKDEAGTDLLSTLERKGADTKAVRRLRSYATPVKTRILAGADHSAPQQVVRVDRVRDHRNELTVPLNLLEKSISRADGIIVSDYGCGTISAPLLDRLRSDAKRKQIVYEMQELLAGDVPTIPLFYTTSYDVWKISAYDGWINMYDHHQRTHSRLSFLVREGIAAQR